MRDVDARARRTGDAGHRSDPPPQEGLPSARAALRYLRDDLKDEAGRRGFSLAGVAEPAPSEHGAFYRRWLDQGRHGEMAYLARPDAVARREDLRGTMADVGAVLVVAHEYFQEDPHGDPADPSRGVIARYARGRDYHKVVKKRLLGLLEWLGEEARGRGIADRVQGRAYVDTGPLLERELGRRAGLGWFGKNTMLIHPRRGSWFFLGVLLLDLDLPADPPFAADHCGTCTRCLEACPTGALLGRDESGAPVIDARRCISYLTIEQRGPIPEELRGAVGNRVYGCDICQEVCPFTRKFSTSPSEPAFAGRAPGEVPFGVQLEAGASRSHPGTRSPSLIALLETALDGAAWDAFSRGSAIRRAGRSGFARNVCVGLGNWRSEEGVPVLRSALSDPDPLVRGHAAWALGCIGSSSAADVLSAALETEADPFVRAELEAAFARREFSSK